MEHYYEVDVKWKADRLGLMSSPDFDTQCEVVTPPQFAGGIPNKWSPEHLLVAAVNSCLMTTFLAIAEKSRLEYEHFESSGIGKLELIEGKYLISEIRLTPVLSIQHEGDIDKAFKVLHKSEAACLISNSVKSRIVFEPKVKVVTANH